MKFSATLINWYHKNGRDLPWRHTKNPYNIWLSEIMLQQTQVTQGLPYYNTFIKHFPTITDLANADEHTVLKLWQGLGYYSRARNLHFTAKTVANTLNGIFPKTYSEIIKLKGVGDYTASAIASICFNEPTAVVDGNVYRVLSRYFGINTAINSTAGVKEFKALAQTLIDTKQASTYNQAIMDFGATQCKPKNPLCGNCPFSDSCVALEKNLTDTLPVKLKKIKVKKRYFNYLVVKTPDNKTLLKQRTGKGIWQGLNEFPVIETNAPITKETLVLDAFFTTPQLQKAAVSLYNTKDVVHKLSHQHLYTKFWIVETNTELEHAIPWQDLIKFPVPVLIANFLKAFTRNT